jgi:hypothetical protein
MLLGLSGCSCDDWDCIPETSCMSLPSLQYDYLHTTIRYRGSCNMESMKEGLLLGEANSGDLHVH